MGCASLVIGFLSLTGVLISLIPFLNFLNCVTLPVAFLGLIFSLADLVSQKEAGQGKWSAVFGLLLNGIALLIGLVRFLISFFTTGGIL